MFGFTQPNQEIPIVHMYNDVKNFVPTFICIYEESKDVLLHLQENVCMCVRFVCFLVNPKLYYQGIVFR